MKTEMITICVNFTRKKDMTDLVHKHLLVRAEVLNPPISTSWCSMWLTSLVSKIDMKILKGPIVAYSDKVGNRGLTGIVIIETSHIAFHSWDEAIPAVIQLDIYSCKDFEPKHIFKELEVFNLEKLEYKFLDRKNNFKTIERNVYEY